MFCKVHAIVKDIVLQVTEQGTKYAVCTKRREPHSISISDIKKKNKERISINLTKWSPWVSTPTHLTSHGDAFCVSAEPKGAAL